MGVHLDHFLSSYSREAREITLCLRRLILDIFPDGFEHIDSKSGIMAYGFNTTPEGLVFAIVPHMKYVNLIFGRGTQIPDPYRLLAGTGKQVRHVKIRSEAETEDPAFRQLLKEALKFNYKD